MKNPPGKKTPNKPRQKNARSTSKKSGHAFSYDIANFFTSSLSHFSRMIRPIKSQARRWLHDAGLPFDPHKAYSGRMTLPSYIRKLGHNENSSPAWYAAEFLWLARKVEEHIRSKDTDSAAFWAFIFGKTYAEAGMKSQLGMDALRMGKVKKGSHVGGLYRGKQQTTDREKEWAKWQAEAEKIWKKHPTWGHPAVAKEVHKKYPDCAEDTIRKRIKKPTP